MILLTINTYNWPRHEFYIPQLLFSTYLWKKQNFKTFNKEERGGNPDLVQSDADV